MIVREGGIIKEGYNEEVDKLRQAKTEGKNWLAQLEEQERERTGIKNLRIKYNKVFGYYLEVTNSYKDHGAGRLYAQADAYQRGALHHPETQGAGGNDPGRRGQAVFPGI